jgi:hypothetical protein
VSLGRFQNCNLLKMENFRRHGVEDEPSGVGGHLVFQKRCLRPSTYTVFKERIQLSCSVDDCDDFEWCGVAAICDHVRINRPKPVP